MRGLHFRCKIGIQIGESVRSIYCHDGGTPEEVGVVLRDNYDLHQTNELLKLGDMSYLRETPEASNFYARDRELEAYLCEARDYDTVDAFLAIGPVDYFYLLTDDGWKVKSSKDVDNYRVVEEFISIDDALLIKAVYRKPDVKSPKW